MSTDGCQTDQPEQQDSSTRIQRLPMKQRWANYRREIKENRIKVVKLIAGGFVKHVYIPTRCQWLKMCRGEWGATEEETAAFIKDATTELFNIEVCGSHQGYAVIIRDSVRNPILAISRVAEDYVSPFYHELQGVSLALKLAMKYKIFSFSFYCISEDIAEYVTLSWASKRRCDCPPRDNPRNPGEKLDYCVRCLSYTIDEIDEGSNADKILSLINEIFSDALQFERHGYQWFDLWPATELCAKAVQHLANSGIDQDLRVDEIEEDEELAEILYKEVFSHGTEQEVMLQRNSGAECS
ncbi:hypothetical protein MKW94_012416 [Papaver nudicaule]|uniref:Uncharacterized protein n=1 Tax=Papaver nudicaule TaxID=74823 RepID=A0AA41VLE8_PAPNU|nr:hypothetical protein [Papaver nudicaule]